MKSWKYWRSLILTSLRIFIFGLLLMHAQWALVGAPISFTVKGDVISHYYNGKGSSSTNAFTVSYAAGKYHLRLMEPPGASNYLLATECVFDGLDCYSSLLFDTNRTDAPVYRIKEGQPVPRQQKGAMSIGVPMIATVTSGPRPPVEQPGLNLLWLAFAAQDYFPQHDAQQRPLFQLGLCYKTFDLKLYTTWRANGSPPGSLEFLSQFHEGKLFSARNNKLVASSLPPPHNKGYTNCLFIADDWRTVAGATFPYRFSFVSFTPAQQASSPLQTNILYEGVVTELELKPTAISSPAGFLPRTRIAEERERIIGPRDSVVYSSSNGLILDSLAIAKLPAYNEYHARKSQAARRIVVLVFFAALVVVFAVYLFASRNRVRKITKSD